MAEDHVLLSGWLMKKRREDSGKAKMLVNKYQKRWFELTEDSLAYAKDPNEVKIANIEVFSLLELRWFKRVGELKLELQFPERLLCIKAPSPGEADKWFQAVERLQLERAQTGNAALRTGSDSYVPPVADEPKKSQVATAFTIEADTDSDEDTDTPIAADRRKGSRTDTQSQQQGRNAPAAAAWHTPEKKAAPLTGLPELKITPPQAENENRSNRPPSPRSLLANPRLGNMLVATPSAADHQSYTEEEPVQAFDAAPPVDSPAARPHRQPTHTHDTQAEPSEEEEASRPAYLNTSLKPRVPIQDMVATALRSANSIETSTTMSPTTMSPRSFVNTATASSSRAATPPSATRRRPAPPAREEVLTLDDVPSPAVALPPQPSRFSHSSGPHATVPSRPVSAASARTPPRRAAPGPEDERLELTPAPPQAAAAQRSRLHSAESHGRVSYPPQRGSSAASSSAATHAAASSTNDTHTEDTTWVEEDWDSSDAENETTNAPQPTPPKDTKTHPNAPTAKAVAATAYVAASPRQLELKQSAQQASYNSWDDSDATPTASGRSRSAFAGVPVTDLKHGRTGKLASGDDMLRDVREVAAGGEVEGDECEGSGVPVDADANFVEDDWDADD